MKKNGIPKSSSSNICKCANNKAQSAYGFDWEFVN